jgi:hypothetical protein
MLRLKKSGLILKLPNGWHEVPFVTALELLTQDLSDLDVICKLSGIPKSKLEESTDLETIFYLRQSLLFLQSDPSAKNPEFPKSVTYKGIKHQLPWINYGDVFDLGQASVIQVEHMQSELGKIKLDDNIQVMQLFPVVCAIYLQPIITGESYNYNKAIKLAPEIEKHLDYKTVTNMGSFFLMRLAGLLGGLKNKSLSPFSRKRKVRLVFTNLAQRLVSMLP